MIESLFLQYSVVGSKQTIVSRPVLNICVNHRFSSCSEYICGPSFLIVCWKFMWTIAYRPVLNFYVEKMPGWDKPKSQMTLGHDKNRNRYVSHCIPKCLKILKIGLMHQCASWVSLTHQTMLSVQPIIFFSSTLKFGRFISDFQVEQYWAKSNDLGLVEFFIF